jgi:hypothetical protein
MPLILSSPRLACGFYRFAAAAHGYERSQLCVTPLMRALGRPAGFMTRALTMASLGPCLCWGRGQPVQLPPISLSLPTTSGLCLRPLVLSPLLYWVWLRAWVVSPPPEAQWKLSILHPTPSPTPRTTTGCCLALAHPCMHRVG